MIFAGSFENRMDLIGSSIRQAGKLSVYCRRYHKTRGKKVFSRRTQLIALKRGGKQDCCGILNTKMTARRCDRYSLKVLLPAPVGVD